MRRTKINTPNIAKKPFKITKAFVAFSLAAVFFLVAISTSLSIGVSAAQIRVELGTASSFVVLAGAGITNTGPTTASGSAGADFGSAPTFSFTGVADVTTTGVKYIELDAAVESAKAALETAYLDAAGRTPSTVVPTELGGSTLLEGVYSTESGELGITGTLTLDAQNNPDAVWIFQAGSTLITATDSRVELINGADACNIFWQVTSSATLGTGSALAGTVMALESITATTAASVTGRLLARNGAVTLDTNTFVNDLCTVPTPTPTETTPAPEETTPAPVPEQPAATPEETPIEETPTPEETVAEGGQERVTDSGGQLPNTDAFNWVSLFALGLGIIALGTGIYWARGRRS